MSARLPWPQLRPHTLPRHPCPILCALQRRAGAKGFGLFAAVDMKAGQFVIEYLGEVLEEEEYHRRYGRVGSVGGWMDG